MSKTALLAELAGDPLARGYAGMTAAQAAASLGTLDRTRNRASVAVSAILDAIVWTEYDAVATTLKERLGLILARDTINANSTNVRATFLAAFAAGSATRTALLALLAEPISRATELGFDGPVTPGLIEWVRSRGE